jgi:hypothetical protein
VHQCTPCQQYQTLRGRELPEPVYGLQIRGSTEAGEGITIHTAYPTSIFFSVCLCPYGVNVMGFECDELVALFFLSRERLGEFV